MFIIVYIVNGGRGMDIVVQKYGGSSVANKEKLLNIVENIKKEKEQKKSVVVVVSAQGKTTDGLIAKSREYVEHIYPKEMDLLLSTGELQTVALLTMMLKEHKIDAEGLSGEQAGVITTSEFSHAKVKIVLAENITKLLEEGKVVIVAGFQGVDRFGSITTLGRGGSDLSAVAIAVALKADRCEIYTDVDGVYSADPNVIPKAVLIKNISYDEMLEAATCGAKVLHNRSVSVARKYNMPVMVKNATNSRGGTIMTNGELEEYGPKLVTFERDLTKVSLVGDGMYSNVKYMTKVYEIAEKMDIKIYMVDTNELSINILVKSEVAESFASALHEEMILK